MDRTYDEQRERMGIEIIIFIIIYIYQYMERFVFSGVDYEFFVWELYVVMLICM
jgi:hypothetical protein